MPPCSFLVCQDYYNILGLPATFSESQLRRAYRTASLHLHPDKPGGSKEAFEVAAEAHAVLSDPRQHHDGPLPVGCGLL